MFSFFKIMQKPWIDQPVIDYLMGIDPQFVIYYSIHVNEQSILFKFRDERGRFLADIYDTRVKDISIGLQGNILFYTYHIDERLSADKLPQIKKFFDSKIAPPLINSKLDKDQLANLQGQFRQQLEDTLEVLSVLPIPPGKSYTGVDNDIHIVVNFLSEQQRKTFSQFINRLDCDHIIVETIIHLNLANEEEIATTQTELDMYEVEVWKNREEEKE